MRHAEWKKLLRDPVAIKAREALRVVKEELASNPVWKQHLAHVAIFPDANRKQGHLFLLADLALALPGQTPATRREIAWDAIANADSEEAKALVLAEIKKFTPTRGS